MAFMSIDGTFMKLMVSAARSAIYTCRKFFHCINVMICMGKLVEFDLISYEVNFFCYYVGQAASDFDFSRFHHSFFTFSIQDPAPPSTGWMLVILDLLTTITF